MENKKVLSETLEALHGKDSERDVILCVDDSRVERMIAEAVLKQALPGYRVETARNCEETIRKISGKFAGRVALVFSDVEMQPGENGIGLAVSLRITGTNPDVLEDMRYVPIVLNSSEKDFMDPATMKGDSMQKFIKGDIVDSFITKPIDPLKLQMAVIYGVKNVYFKKEKDSGK